LLSGCYPAPFHQFARDTTIAKEHLMRTPDALRDALADALAGLKIAQDDGDSGQIEAATCRLERAAWRVLDHLDGEK
jgi:hypothetical protein